MGAVVARKRSLGSDRLLGKTPRPPADGPVLMGAAVPRKHSLGSDRLLGRTPRPPGWWAGALREWQCPVPPRSVAMHC